ncbi:MAG: GGDEF domain-containing protein, partial [Woeseia sp.]
ARWGGEEFIVIAPETDRQEACKLAEKIRETVAAHSFPHAKEQPLGIVSLSIGVASRSEETESSDQLLRFADDAVYFAKDHGRNRTVFCSAPEEMHKVA